MNVFNMVLYFLRSICNLTRADDFNDLRREIAVPVIERLRRTYDHVDDVDLFTGKYILTTCTYVMYESESQVHEVELASIMNYSPTPTNVWFASYLHESLS